jgi:phosphoenolpyruvate-protein kinase (PTS system EI component)
MAEAIRGITVLARGGCCQRRRIVPAPRKTRSNLKVGICGEHGGEPSSVEFCHLTGFNYVSCSPFRVLTARLAAAQAAAGEKRNAEERNKLSPSEAVKGAEL